MDVSLSWDSLSDPDIAGYTVYYGLRPGVVLGSQQFATPLNTQDVRVLSLPNARHVYFWVTAFDAAGNISDNSNTVSTINRTTSFLR